MVGAILYVVAALVLVDDAVWVRDIPIGRAFASGLGVVVVLLPPGSSGLLCLRFSLSSD